MKQLSKLGITVIELLLFVLLLLIVVAIAVANIRGLRADNRDDQRKTDINAIYYQLESNYLTANSYPQTLSTKTLQNIDEARLKDSNNVLINEEMSEYTYRPSNCSKGNCKSFELKTSLEREAPYVKLSLNN